MSKRHLAEEMAQIIILKKYQAYDFIELFIEVVVEQLKTGRKVVISGFGTFSVKERLAKRVRNPADGVMITIPPNKTVKFQPSPKLKQDIGGTN